MESHSASRSATEQALEDVQIMLKAAREEQIRIQSQEEKDQSQLVSSIYQNAIKLLDQFQWLSEEKPDSSTQQLHHALAYYYYGNCYHHLGNATQALKYFSLAARYFEGLVMDATCTSYYADTLLLKGMYEKSLGNHLTLSRYNEAENSFKIAIGLWRKLADRGVESAPLELAHCTLHLGEVMTFNGHSAEKAKLTVVTLLDALAQFQKLAKAKQLLAEELAVLVNLIYHFLGVNYLRAGQYDEALNYLTLLLDNAQAAQNLGLQHDAKLGIALCHGLQAERGFFMPEVIAMLGMVYQYYIYDAKNTRLRNECIAVVRIWLQGLSLPEERPEQLNWIVSLLSPKREASETRAPTVTSTTPTRSCM